jgi:voltage-gated potassium channel
VARPRVVERRMTRFLSDPVSVRNAAAVIVAATALVVVIGAVFMTLLDHDEYPNVWVAMWWALQTVTTVGYGDVTPQEPVGRLVATFMMLEGIAFLAITTAAITSTFVARAQRESASAEAADELRSEQRITEGLDELAARLDRVETMLQRLTNAGG